MSKYLGVFLFLMMTIVLSCDRQDKKHPYSDAIIKYVNYAGNAEISTLDEHLIIIPLNSCNPCVKTTITNLLEKEVSRSKLKVLLSGSSPDSEMSQLIKKLNTQFDCTLDSGDNLRLFRTNISGPVFVEVKDNNVIDVVELENKSLSEILN